MLRPTTAKRKIDSPRLELPIAENLEPFDYRSVSFPNRKVNIKANFDKSKSLYRSIVTKTEVNPEIANS